MEAARGGEIQHAGVAPQFQDHAGEIGQTCRLFCNPQRVAELGRFGEKKAMRRNAKGFANAGGVWQASFGKGVRCGQPQKRQLLFRLALQKSITKRQRKSRGSTRSAGCW